MRVHAKHASAWTRVRRVHSRPAAMRSPVEESWERFLRRMLIVMNEFDLQAWERELEAWRRRLDRHPPGALRSLVGALALELVRARTGEVRRADGLKRGFADLRRAYERLLDRESTSIPA
jgi:hypothetical protein